MDETEVSAEVLTEEELAALEHWRQGDYTLQRSRFPLIVETDDEDLYLDTVEACGWVVITQTCDIVNYGEGKDFVSICPIVKAFDPTLKDIKAGVTPAFAKLELAPDEHHVIDLGRIASIHKRALSKLERRDGFHNDATRSVFQQALERRFGRFAFPDWLSNGPLRQLRNRAREAHKSGGSLGDVYKAIDEFRVRGNPDLESKGAAIGFLAIVDRDKFKNTSRIAIQDEFAKQAKKFKWPDDYIREDDFLVIGTLDDFSGRDIKESHAVDLDFISARSDAKLNDPFSEGD